MNPLFTATIPQTLPDNHIWINYLTVVIELLHRMSVIQELLNQFLVALIPSTRIQIGWWLIGGGFARAFGKKLDYDIQQTVWFKELGPNTKNLVKRLLNFLHHWWLGWILMDYISKAVPFETELYWFGAGVLVDDLPDLVLRLKEMVGTILGYMSEEWNNNK